MQYFVLHSYPHTLYQTWENKALNQASPGTELSNTEGKGILNKKRRKYICIHTHLNIIKDAVYIWGMEGHNLKNKKYFFSYLKASMSGITPYPQNFAYSRLVLLLVGTNFHIELECGSAQTPLNP